MEPQQQNNQKQFLKLPSTTELREALHSFNKREGIFVGGLVLLFLISTVWLLGSLNTALSVPVPVRGGSVTEGVIGTPRFVNPLLALSEADRDLTALIYSGLVREQPDGSIAPDLAERYTVSEDGKMYTFHLREDAVFHDGTPVTADDIVFTISRAKNPSTRSLEQISWDSVSAEKIDTYTIEITLPEPSPTFIESATLGILPKHLWEEVPADQMSYSELNIEAIGSGPFRVKRVTQKKNSLIESYVLKPFKRFTLGTPYLKQLTLAFYPNKESLYSAYKSGKVDQMSAVDPEVAYVLKRDGERVETTPLPRIFGLFFNQNEAPVFADAAAVEAISKALDRREIVNRVLFGFGETIATPIPKTVLREQDDVPAKNTEDAVETLESGGWSQSDDGTWRKRIGGETRTLSFSITTGDAPELKRAAFAIKEQLASLGIPVEVSVYEIGNLNQNVIRPRKYEALFFGQIVANETDLYAFWHSSQRNDPGLNIALFINARADSILEKVRITTDHTERTKLYQELNTIISKNAAAVFIYSPAFIYVIDNQLEGVELGHIETGPDRFNTVYRWYTQTDYLWKFLTKRN